MKTYHPRKNDKGHPVPLLHPSQPTDQSTWQHADQLATVISDGPMPEQVNHLAVASWGDAPTDSAGWERLAGASKFDEPPMTRPTGLAPASGAVVMEPDGRVWVVSPSNGFGGYAHTFPKGKLDPKEGLSLRANALKEIFEESGLRVELTDFLCDSIRTTSVTRYYLAMRVGGNPAAMGWESQATHLVPMAQLAQFVAHPNDEIVVGALRSLPQLPEADILSSISGLSSVHRILATIAGFRRQYGYWPTRLLLDGGMCEAVPRDLLTPLGWTMLNQKLDIVPIDEGTIYAEGPGAQRFEYGDHFHLQEGPSVCFWIWGVELLDR
ncbi:MAG: NUDIX hydrolase [Rhodoferax sp.]|nr:NUDIX hydrolase [Rhodoferax sp.]